MPSNKKSFADALGEPDKADKADKPSKKSRKQAMKPPKDLKKPVVVKGKTVYDRFLVFQVNIDPKDTKANRIMEVSQ